MHFPSLRYVGEACRQVGPRKALLFAVAFHADRKSGECFASYSTLAKTSGVARSKVQVLMHELLEAGELALVVGGAGRRASTYQIVIDADRSVPTAGTQRAKGSVPQGGTQQEPVSIPADGTQAVEPVDTPVDAASADAVSYPSRRASVPQSAAVAYHNAGASIGSGRQDLEGEKKKDLMPAVADSTAKAVGDGSADSNGDRHERGKRAARALIEELKGGREAQSRARALSQLAQPRPVFVRTVARTVALDAVLVPTPVTTDARDPPRRATGRGAVEAAREMTAA